MQPARVLVLALGIACGACTAPTGVDPMRQWPAWRGPLHTGVAPFADPPIHWSESRNVRWKVALPGPGHSTPVVWGDHIYVLSAVDTGVAAAVAVPDTLPTDPPPRAVYRFVVSAFDLRTGEAAWHTVVREEVPHERGHETASQASASPVTDGKHLYASFGSRGIYCLSLDGRVRWEKDLGRMQTHREWGEGASPVLHGETLVVNWDHDGASFIVALNKRDGEELWRVPRDEASSWSTPLIVEDAGRAVVIVSASNRVRAYDLETGDELWSCAGLGRNCIPTPVADDRLVFVMSGFVKAAGMAIRYPGARGDLTDTDAVAWTVSRVTSYVPSPLLQEGRLYFLRRFKGRLNCVELAGGRECLPRSYLEGLGNIYASPVGAAGRIYVIDRNGTALVLEHREGLEVLARNSLDDGFDASPVPVGDALYLRGHRHLYCLGPS